MCKKRRKLPTGDVQILIKGSGKNRTSMIPKPRRIISAPPKQWNPERCTGNNHLDKLIWEIRWLLIGDPSASRSYPALAAQWTGYYTHSQRPAQRWAPKDRTSADFVCCITRKKKVPISGERTRRCRLGLALLKGLPEHLFVKPPEHLYQLVKFLWRKLGTRLPLALALYISVTNWYFLFSSKGTKFDCQILMTQ